MLALASLRTGWFRVENATVQVTPQELRELHEHDVVLGEVPAQPEQGELVLSTGARFGVSLDLEDGDWIATVGPGVTASSTNEFAINLAYRVCDPRELPETKRGVRIALAVTAEDPFVLSWRNEVVGQGRFVEIEDERGVRVTSLRRS